MVFSEVHIGHTFEPRGFGMGVFILGILRVKMTSVVKKVTTKRKYFPLTLPWSIQPQRMLNPNLRQKEESVREIMKPKTEKSVVAERAQHSATL